MQSSFSTPSSRYALNGGPSNSSQRTSSQSFSRDGEGFSTPVQQQTARLNESTSSLATRNVQSQQQSSLNVSRPRKSTVPDIGTPIKVASSSPYRTPESTSKASLFLSRTPFGTPAARNGPSSTLGSSSTVSKSTTVTQPLKPVTGFWPQVWPLFKSLLDENAYATFALQPRPHLTFSGFIETALRINWLKLLVFSLPVYHALFCISLFRPTNPLQLITLPLRPTALFLSLTSYSIFLGLLLIIPGQRFNIASKKWTVQDHSGVRDERLAGGFILSAGSPASLLVRSLRQGALWRGVLLHAAFSLAIATTHALALAHYTNTTFIDGKGSKTSNPWSPYHHVSVRLSQGYKTTAIRPNERFWFLLCSNAILGATYAIIRAVLFSRPQVPGAGAPAPFAPSRFEAQATFESALVRIAAKGRQTIYRAVFLGSITPSIILQGYLLIRRPFFRVVLSLIGHHSPLRPLLVPSFKRPLFNIDLIFRVSILGLVTVLILEAFSVAWEVLSTQPIGLGMGGLSKFSSAPTKCLIKGMQSRRIPLPEEAHLGGSERSYYSHFAFAEMATVMATDAERRKAIFRDVGQSIGGNGGSILHSIPPSGLDSGAGRSAWAVIAGECINVIQEERKWLLNKGKEPIASGTASTSSSQKLTNHLKPVDAAHQVSLATGNNGVNKSKPTIWDRLASTSPVASQPSATTAPSTTNATSTQVNANATEGLNSLLHRIAPPPIQSTPAASSTSGTAASLNNGRSTSFTSRTTLLDVFVNIMISSIQSVGSVFKLLPSDLQHVLQNSIVARKIEGAQKWLFASSDDSLLAIGVLPHDEALVTWSVQILGSLLAASLEQDEYGTVALAASSRLGIDDVLEECAILLNALQQLGLNITQNRADGIVSSETSLFVFDHDVAPLITTLRTTITLVLGAFEPTGYRLRPSCRKAVDDALASPKSSSN
ncbi:hypothetical protein L7F22_068224 [Adiantum nelumboides]|nr:hypothetical protein [Adiantum nelumboides]